MALPQPSSVANTSPEEYVFWLKGIFQVNPDYFSKGMTGEEVARLATKLDTVFTHVAPAPTTALAPQGKNSGRFEAMC